MNIFPVGVSNPEYDEALPPDCLSYVVLLRRAIGALLSRNERNRVIIDDRPVNVDPTRMRRLCRILEEAATNHCQVVATCNDTPYAGVGGGEGGVRITSSRSFRAFIDLSWQKKMGE